MLVGQRKKSQKYFDLSTFNYNLYDSNPCSSLGVMNFQKWELFSGSPGIHGNLIPHHYRRWPLTIDLHYLSLTKEALGQSGVDTAFIVVDMDIWLTAVSIEMD